jgi:hypothetical protein
VALRRMAAGDPLYTGIVVTLRSDCCQATAFADRAAGGDRCSQCERPCTPVRYQVVEELSSCCGAELRTAGLTTRYYVCTACSLPCDRAASGIQLLLINSC